MRAVDFLDGISVGCLGKYHYSINIFISIVHNIIQIIITICLLGYEEFHIQHIKAA